jgi:hypothetical protein
MAGMDAMGVAMALKHFYGVVLTSGDGAKGVGAEATRKESCHTNKPPPAPTDQTNPRTNDATRTNPRLPRSRRLQVRRPHQQRLDPRASPVPGMLAPAARVTVRHGGQSNVKGLGMSPKN